jgi:Rha family phage regulatory protein
MRNELVEINGVEVEFNMMSDGFSVTSLDIARVFEKRHADVIRSIENKARFKSFVDQRKIALVKYSDKKGEIRKSYQLDRDAFIILAFGFTGKKVEAWQDAFVDAFNKMEAMIRIGIKESEQLLQANKDLLFIVKELGFSENSFKPTKDGRIKTKVRKSCLTADTSKDKEKRLSNVKKANKVVTQIVKTDTLIASRNLNPYEKYLKKIGGKDPRALI